MHHQQVLELARLVRLSRSAIARHFGISAVQVIRWGMGRRPVPKKYREALWTLVQDAAIHFLRSGQADVWPTPDPGGLAGLIRHHAVPPLRRQITDLLHPLTLAHMELRGTGPSALIDRVAADLA